MKLSNQPIIYMAAVQCIKSCRYRLGTTVTVHVKHQTVISATLTAAWLLAVRQAVFLKLLISWGPETKNISKLQSCKWKGLVDERSEENLAFLCFGFSGGFLHGQPCVPPLCRVRFTVWDETVTLLWFSLLILLHFSAELAHLEVKTYVNNQDVFLSEFLCHFCCCIRT